MWPAVSASRRTVSLLLVALVCACGNARAGDGWPAVKVPDNASMETIASDMLLNGKQTRMLRFQAHATSAEVMAFYRNEFGANRVENRVKADHVIATRQGDYFITVQLHVLDNQLVEGTTMTTLMAGQPVTSAVLVDTRKLLPADTQVISSVQTADDGKQSLMVIGVNLNGLHANLDHVIEAMAERGFRLTKQVGEAEDKEASAVSIQLASPAEEASVTISDAGRYRSIVINRIRGPK